MAVLDLYKLPPLSVPYLHTINSITIKAVMGASHNTGTTGRIAIKTGGTIYYGTLINPLPITWTLYSKTYTTNPKTGQPWTVTDINALEVGIELAGSSYLTTWYVAYCTQVYVPISYTLSDIYFFAEDIPLNVILKSKNNAMGLTMIPAKQVTKSIFNALGLTANYAKLIQKTIFNAFGLSATSKQVMRSKHNAIGLTVRYVKQILKSIFGSYEIFRDVEPVVRWEIVDNPKALLTISVPYAILTIDRYFDSTGIKVERLRT